MGFDSKRAAAVVGFVLTAAACGTVNEYSEPSATADLDDTTTAPAQVALDDREPGDTATTAATEAEGGLIVAESTITTMPTTEATDNATTAAPTDPPETTAPSESTTTAADTTTAAPTARAASERIVSEADFEANGIAIASNRSVSEEAAPQDARCGVPDPTSAGRLTQVFETPGGTLIAQYVQEGADASDQWMAALTSLAGCNDVGVSPMRLVPGSAIGSEETLVLSSNGSDEDGGYMAVVGGRKGNLVTGFMTVSTDPSDAALSTDALLKLLEIAIAN